MEHDAKDPIAARKIQKADQEKTRRDQLNEQFLELGKALGQDMKILDWGPNFYMYYRLSGLLGGGGQIADPDCPENDKATILADTIQMLNDLTTQVNKLKTEHDSLSEESRELTLEKNELREEKAAIKSEIDNFNAQYHRRLGCVYPWGAMDPSIVRGPPPSYPYPVPVPIPSIPIPIHQLQPYPLFRNQTDHGAIPNPYSSHMPHGSTCDTQVEPSFTQRLPPRSHPSRSRSQTSNWNDSRCKSSDLQQPSVAEKSDDFSDVVMELDFKTPGSAGLVFSSESGTKRGHVFGRE